MLLNAFPFRANFGFDTEQRISCQWYSWFTYFQREGRDWAADLDLSFAEFSKAGYKAFEPNFNSLEEVDAYRLPLEKYDIKIESFYVNSILHDEDKLSESMEQVLAISDAAKTLGARIVVTNPSPIEWGGPQNKNDHQLDVQARALEDLGKELKQSGMTLAYHNHDAEMRLGAREFHHMMSTDADSVSLCLDSHWIYRGAGDSQIALFDIVELYRDRIVELHLRQSLQGLWTEAFGVGDIDYSKLSADLKKHDMAPLIVMEQAIEEGTPHKMQAISALAESRQAAIRTFEALL